MIHRYLPVMLLIFASLPLPAQTRQANSTIHKRFVDDNNNFTSTGNIGMTVTNYGVFGDGFVEQAPTDQPSCEYPRGSGIEHIFDGGLWVGAETPTGIRVTTGAFNSARIGSAGSVNFEFTNTAEPTDIVVERSSLPANKFFSPQAISHQDFIIDFSDTNIIVPGTPIPIPNHQPLGLSVHLETYAWNFPFADAFVIFNYTITNVGYEDNRDTLKNVHVGLWADMVVRNVNILPPRVGAPFYQDVGVGRVDNPDTAQMIYAYEYNGSANYTGAESYVSLVYLGAKPQRGDDLYELGKITTNWWLFSGGNEDWQRAPSDEASRYQRMSESIEDDVYWNDVFRNRNNFMNLISTGPFERIAPDSSVNVVFAVVCGKKFGTAPTSSDNAVTRRNLVENVSWAQRAYHGEDSNRNGVLDFLGSDSSEDVNGNGRLDRYILPTPPDAPRVKVIPGSGTVTLMWDDSAEESIDFISKQKDFEGYRVYRSFLGSDREDTGIFDNMQLVHEYDLINDRFYDTGLESVRMETPLVEIGSDPFTGLPDTITYRYQLQIDNLHNGWQYAFAVSAFDSGDVKLNLPSLESSRLQNVILVSPGTPPRQPGSNLQVGVYPNPYRTGAIWDGGFERERKLHFYNLPRNCEVRIYTIAGDLVDSFEHRGDFYRGEDILWYQNFSEGNTVFPGGEHAWDLVTDSDQAIATGLYLFTVKDNDTGEVHKGKFVIIK